MLLRNTIISVACVLCLSGPVWAISELNFDDLPAASTAGSVIPVGYSGFTWDNMYYLDPVSANKLGSGYEHGLVSPLHVAYNGYGDMATVSHDPFDFVGVHFAGAWMDDLNIRVQGYRDGSPVYDNTIVASFYEPTWYAFNYLDVDQVTFDSFGGIDMGWGYSPQFVMDNFTFVPEPATMSLLAMGGLAALRRRKSQIRRGEK